MAFTLAFAFLASSLLAWIGQRWLVRQFARYRHAFKRHARRDLAEMFLFLDPGQLWFASLALSLTVVGIVGVLAGSPVVMGLGAALMLPAPWLVLGKIRQHRLQRMDRQLPDLLLALAGALRAGVGMQAALRHLVDHTPAPLSQELALMLREQRMGVPFEEALSGLHVRVPTEGARLMVSALTIASHTGGQLADTLERISATLRARLHIDGRIRALTAQGRMQAWVMACLPAGLAWVLHWLEPQAMAALWTTPAGWAVLVLIVLLEMLGMFLIRRIVRIKV